MWTARRWGRLLAAPLTAGHRLLVAGNGGSAAEAQHLTAELVGRYVADGPRCPPSRCTPRRPASPRSATTSARLRRSPGRWRRTACRQTLLVLSASGHSENVLAAADRARSLGIRVWAMTGPPPNPLATMADDVICVAAPDTATVQEVHLVAIHALCDALDAEVTRRDTSRPARRDSATRCSTGMWTAPRAGLPDAPAPVLENLTETCRQAAPPSPRCSRPATGARWC